MQQNLHLDDRQHDDDVVNGKQRVAAMANLIIISLLLSLFAGHWTTIACCSKHQSSSGLLMIVFKLKTSFVNKRDAIITIMAAFLSPLRRGKYHEPHQTNKKITHKTRTHEMKKSLKIDKKRNRKSSNNSKFDLSLSKDNPRNPSD